ncbi:MAG: nitroreductase family protein [Candidatus Micrarchaeia archaeon]|jgi:nitroreductase
MASKPKARCRTFLELAKARKTVYEFSGKPVGERELGKILEAGRWAPSCTNSQPWNFVVVRERKRIEELMRTANYGDFHGTPALLIALVLRQKLCAGPDKVCFRNVKTYTHDTYMSIAAAGLQIALEATDLGVGSCFLTPEAAKAKKLLKTLAEDDVPLMVGLGFEKKGAFQKKRERRALGESVSYEFFGGRK